MKEILQFIISPKETIKKDSSIYQTLWRFLILFFLGVTFSIASLLLIEILRSSGILPSYLKETSEATKVARSNIFFVAVLVPILEELAFRFYLKRNSITIFISAFFISYLIISGFIFNTAIYSFENDFILRIGISFIFALIILYVYKKQLITIKFNALYYFSALFFGLIHIHNHDYTNPKILPFAIVICLPQILSGLFLAYTRIKYGLLGSIALHSFKNGLFILIPLLF